jgi:hypothetical protein
MILLGSSFSPAFAEVILLTDVTVLVVVLAAAFYDQIAGAWVKAMHRASATLAFVATRFGVRHR